LLIEVLGELAGIALLVVFVLGLVTMPPIEFTRGPAGAGNAPPAPIVPAAPGAAMTPPPPVPLHIRVDTAQWRKNTSDYLAVLHKGSLGENARHRPVGPMVAERLKNSLELIGLSVAVVVFLGIIKGFWDFNQMQRRSLPIGPAITSLVQGLPDFWLILVLQLGSVWMFQHFGWNPFKVAWSSQEPFSSLVYPVITLSLIPLAYMARTTSTALETVYGMDYIRTARSKGLSRLVVLYKHALRNALVQILDGLPGVIAVMVSNLLIVEYMFGFPGLTTTLKDSIVVITGQERVGNVTYFRTGSDTPVLVAAGVALGLVFSVLYTVVRILRRLVDPRLQERDQA